MTQKSLKPANDANKETKEKIHSVENIYRNILFDCESEIASAIEKHRFECNVPISSKSFDSGTHEQKAADKVLKELERLGYSAFKHEDTSFTGVDEWEEIHPRITICWDKPKMTKVSTQ